MDYYDAENKTFKPLKHSGIQYNRDKQAIEAGMAEAEHQYQLHQASTFKPGLFAHADSQSMVLVKEAEKALIDFCNNTTYTPYSPDSYLSSSQQKQFTELYDKLIIRCEEYINSQIGRAHV